MPVVHTMRRSVAIASVAAALVAPFALVGGTAKASSQPEGSLDASYGYSNGRAVDWTSSASALPNAQASAVMPDGRVVEGMASITQELGGAARYLPDGSPDLTFGTNGHTVINNGDPTLGDLHTVAVEPDGAVLIAGDSFAGSQAAAVIRYTSAGALDTGFGSGGLVTLQATPAQPNSATALAVQPNGGIIVGGTDGSDMFVARLTPAGQLDSSFGTGGYATAQANGNPTTVEDIALDSTGRIVTAGDESSNGFSGFALTRWTSTGQPDTTFGGTGAIAEAFLDIGSSTHDSAYAVAIQPDGKIVAAGGISFADQDLAVVRYNDDGSRDGSFATDGVWTANTSSTEAFHDVALQRDGKIVAVGLSDQGTATGDDYVIARLTSHGATDSTFGITSAGLSIVDFTGSFDAAAGVGILRNGRIVVSGVSAGGNENPSMLRLFGDLTAPSAPSTRALPRYSLSSAILRWNAATDDNTGVHTYNVLTQSMRYDATGAGPAGVYKTGLISRQTGVSRKPGFTRCFVVQARDYAGNLGAPGSEACTAFPVDDRTLGHSGSWTSGKGKAYYLGTFRRSSSAGSSLSLKVAFRHLALVATTCPTCGTVRVFLGKKLLVTKSLHASRTHNRVVIPIASASSIRSGTVRIVQASGGKQVVIDGLAVSQG